MNPLLHRRQVLAYLGLGLTTTTIATALKGCAIPTASSSSESSQKPVAAESPTTIANNSSTGGKALPEFTGVQEWLNSSPLTIADLKGSVVLVQIWTFACINCQRTLPYVVKWQQKYASQGLKVVGIHTPEFAFERDINQIKAALNKHHITYPIAVDNDHKMWSAYDNEYWPHLYLADRRGIVQYDHIGEGAYEETEQKIRQLLG
jgi:thiol-disulfide isomerase/thioredoxin